jgi:phage anti-repressor protein/predicted GIY-YIG superfamily endonuclease
MKAITYIKKISGIPNDFIDDLFSFYDENTLQTDFVINLDKVALWLDVHKRTLNETLKHSYKQKFDYIITKNKNPNQKDPRSNNYKQVLITPDCFKRLCMLTRSKKGETVRSYFIDIENTLIKYRQQTLNGIKSDMKFIIQKRKPKYEPNTGYVYIIRVKNSYENKPVYKPGYTSNIDKRMATYQTGKIDDIDIVYLYKTDDIKAVEGCMKAWLKNTQYINNKELYQVDLGIIKKIINECANIGLKLHHQTKINKPDDQLGGYYVLLKKI